MEQVLIVVATMYQEEIFSQLREMGFRDGFDAVERGREYLLPEQ